jgi:hypothetical protein
MSMLLGKPPVKLSRRNYAPPTKTKPTLGEVDAFPAYKLVRQRDAAPNAQARLRQRDEKLRLWLLLLLRHGWTLKAQE